MAVSIAFNAKDGLSVAMKKATRQVQIFGKTSTAAFERATRSSNKYSGALKGAFAFLSAREVLNFANKSIEAWNKQEAAVKNVEAGIKSTGMAAGRTLEQLTALASALQTQTFFGDEAILQGVTAQMLTFTNITGESFDRAQKAVLDVTAKLKGLDATESDLKGTTIMLSKALNDPVANLSAMSRAGIQFSDEQKTLIKSLAQTGRMAEAQSLILAELEKQYGGTAEALAMTDAGKQIQIMNAIGDAMEEVGKALLPVKLQLLNIANILIPFVPHLINLAPAILTIVAAWKAYAIATAIATKFQTGFNLAMLLNPTGLVVAGIVLLIGIIALLVIKWDKVKNALVSGAMFIKNIFIKLWEGIKNGFISAFSFIKKYFLTFVDLFLTLYGTIAKTILKGAITVGKALGKDVSGLENAMGKLEATQAKVRSQSLVGDVQNKRKSPNKKQAAAQSGSYRGELTVNAPAGSTVTERKRGAQPIKMQYVGAN